MVHIPLQTIELDGRCPISISEWNRAIEKASELLEQTIGEDRRVIPFRKVLEQYGVTEETWMRLVDSPDQWPPLPRPIRLTSRKKFILVAELERFQAALLATEQLGLLAPSSIPNHRNK